jgi:hypothetical protein
MGIVLEFKRKPAMQLLTSFNRGYQAHEGLRTELVKCRLWVDDLDAFLAKHRPIPAPHPTPDKITKWMEYMTATKEELA